MLDMIFKSEGSWYNLVIILAGIVVMAGLVASYSKFKKQEEKYNTQNRKIKEKNVEVTGENSASLIVQYEGISNEFMDSFEEEYGDNSSFYNMWIQLIGLFPMAGILGTVMGLMKQVAATGIDELTSSVALALGSTIVAIVWAIILKTVDIIWVGKIADKLEGLIAKYNNRFQNQATIKQIENSKVKGK